MKSKLLFIYNPNAGKAAIRNKLSSVVEIFTQADYEVTVYPTKAKYDAKDIVLKRASDFNLIVCAGGDGTLNEITDAVMLMEEKPSIGYIPAGTINDFASSLNISKNITEAAKTIISGKLFPYDVGSMQFNKEKTEFFTYIAAFGAFTDVAYGTPQATKNILGRLAYILEGIKRIPSLTCYTMKVYYEDIIIEDTFIFGMITNSNSIGGFKGLSGKNVSLDDGLFEIALIKMPKNPIELQSIVNALLLREIDNQYIYSFHCSKLRLESEVLVPWTIDGEFGGETKEAIIENNKKAVTYIIPLKKGQDLLETKEN